MIVQKAVKQNKTKLSGTQIFVLQQIRRNGKYPVKNNQNPTARKLITLGVCEWNAGYDALILTEKFKNIKL